MSLIFEIKRGSTWRPLQCTVTPKPGGSLPTAEEIAGATGALFMRHESARSASQMDGDVTLVYGETSLLVQYDWDAGDIGATGTYYAEFEITLTSGLVWTIPTSGFITIVVTPDLGDAA